MSDDTETLYLCYARQEHFDYDDELKDGLQESDIIQVAEAPGPAPRGQGWAQMVYAKRAGGADIIIQHYSRILQRRGWHTAEKMTLEQWKREIKGESTPNSRIKKDAKGKVKEFVHNEYLLLPIA